LDKDLFIADRVPAVSVGLSVSRVGAAAQRPIMKNLSGSLKGTITQYFESEIFKSFNDEIDSTTVTLIERGDILMALLKQTVQETYHFF